MALRFQRRIRILPGLYLKLSKSGVGFSVGGRGAHVGIDARGRKYVSTAVPGISVSFQEYQRNQHLSCDHCIPGQAHVPLWLAALLVLAVVVLIAPSR
jgi:hypothetical protein